MEATPTCLYVREIQDHGHDHVGQAVTLKGWLYNARASKKYVFLQVRDGTGIIQAVVTKEQVSPELWALAESLEQEASIIVTGTLAEDARSTLGFELHVTAVEKVATGDGYPITPKDHGVAFLMENRHLWLRSRRQNVILRIRHTLVRAIRDYFDNHGFTLVDAPILTPSACEGTSTLFELNYFDMGSAYLSQSGQLYMEPACQAFGKAYCFGPTFRAEKSKTRRHLTEFWMVEPEVAYATHEDNIRLVEDFLTYIVARALETHRKEFEIIERDIKPLEAATKPLIRKTYTEAVAELQKLGSDIQWGDDMGGDDETILTQQYDRPIIVEKYPADAKAFYMKRDPADPRLALCLDVLAPEGYGEIVGGGTREEDLAVLEESIAKHELPMEAFQWYLDVRRYGSVPHSGFGLGLERTVRWVCGLPHVRETIPFPRLMERITP
jgi:asparaginyl-tRNA synthetase